MSWHGRWGRRRDPFAKPAKVGDRFGIFEVVDVSPLPHPHYGIRAKVRCVRCGHERVDILAQLRHRPPSNHRGCNPRPIERRTP